MPTILMMVGIFVYLPFRHRWLFLNPITELCKPKTLKIAVISAIKRPTRGESNGPRVGVGVGVGTSSLGVSVGVGGLGVNVGIGGLGVGVGVSNIDVSLLIGVAASMSVGSGVQVGV